MVRRCSGRLRGGSEHDSCFFTSEMIRGFLAIPRIRPLTSSRIRQRRLPRRRTRQRRRCLASLRRHVAWGRAGNDRRQHFIPGVRITSATTRGDQHQRTPDPQRPGHRGRTGNSAEDAPPRAGGFPRQLCRRLGLKTCRQDWRHGGSGDPLHGQWPMAAFNRHASAGTLTFYLHRVTY